MRKLVTIFMLLLIVMPISGCWDRQEVSQLALVMAKGIDLTEDGRVRVSVQIALPSKVGGSQSGSGKGEGGKSYFVVSGIGRTVSEADARIQEKLPRQLYLPHLRVIVIGDKMARSGIKILDHFGRNPPNRLRSAILVAEHGDALTLLNTTYPLESISGEAIRKLENQLLGVNTTLMEFLVEASSIGTDQYTSAISLETKPDEEIQGATPESEVSQAYFAFKNVAVFKKQKLAGYLDTAESIALQLMNQRIKHVTLTTAVPNTKGTISVELTQAKRRARTFVQGDQVSVNYVLSGSALVTENSTGLDADNPKVVRQFQNVLNQYIQSNSEKCIQTLTSEMDADALGVGQMVFHQHPYAWERLKQNWHSHFANLKYSVVSNVKIIETGKSGPSVFGKPQRGIMQNSSAEVEGDGEAK